jgi:hypothetical protein
MPSAIHARCDTEFSFLPNISDSSSFPVSTDIDMDITYDEINKSGDVYWVLKPFEIVLKNTKKFAVHFDNLFNGDKILGKETELHFRSEGQADHCKYD